MKGSRVVQRAAGARYAQGHSSSRRFTWYPERLDRHTPDNTHVNRKEYRERRRREIHGVGGFEKFFRKSESSSSATS